jgi:SecD/SecF fusion protein
MTQRSFTGLLVLGALLAAVLYLWQPWNTTGLPPLRLGLDLQGGLRVVLQSTTPNPAPEDLQAARRVIENRVNEFGVAEPLVQTSGGDRIVVELPGLSADEQDRAQDLIGQQAVLEFRLVRPQSVGMPVEMMSEADLEPPAFTGEILSGAQTGYDELGRPVVNFQIRGADAQAFGQFTGANVGRSMAIVLDGNVVSAPTINQRIDARGQISGRFTLEEASDLALVLRSGSLPISLQIQEIRAIGPTLGADSVAAGTRAGLIGAVAVVVTVLLFYGPLFGSVLTVGVLFALVLIFGMLAGLGAALTLPGLAGLVLTIGAAVDGNVISFERIKEELRAGKSLRLAMRSGFANSLSAIIDANVTTLIAAAALYQYTSGPVRGFAITLAIGIVAAVFVNTVVVPFLLDVLTLRFRRPRLPRGFYVSGINFLKRAPIVMSISGILAAAALVTVWVMDLNLSTDFTGGTSALLRTAEETTVEDVRAAISEVAADIPGVDGSTATVQAVQDATLEGGTVGAAGAGQLYSVRIGLGQGEGDDGTAFASDLAAALNAELLQADVVGPAVGADLRQGAILAVVVAFGLILIYVGFRFWPNWIVAVAAVLASVHDVALVMGFLALTGAEFSIPVLAALLFVVGYSLNDSIIIADRIRENLRRVRGGSYGELVNLAVNQTLSRTILTSGTTLLPVLALLFFGGSVLRDFSVTLLVGIGVGTFSSIFILAPMIVWFKNRQRAPKPKASVRVRPAQR